MTMVERIDDLENSARKTSRDTHEVLPMAGSVGVAQITRMNSLPAFSGGMSGSRSLFAIVSHGYTYRCKKKDSAHLYINRLATTAQLGLVVPRILAEG